MSTVTQTVTKVSSGPLHLTLRMPDHSLDEAAEKTARALQEAEQIDKMALAGDRFLEVLLQPEYCEIAKDWLSNYVCAFREGGSKDAVALLFQFLISHIWSELLNQSGSQYLAYNRQILGIIRGLLDTDQDFKSAIKNHYTYFDQMRQLSKFEENIQILAEFAATVVEEARSSAAKAINKMWEQTKKDYVLEMNREKQRQERLAEDLMRLRDTIANANRHYEEQKLKARDLGDKISSAATDLKQSSSQIKEITKTL